jgi:hypothetical protein
VAEPDEDLTLKCRHVALSCATQVLQGREIT